MKISLYNLNKHKTSNFTCIHEIFFGYGYVLLKFDDEPDIYIDLSKFGIQYITEVNE